MYVSLMTTNRNASRQIRLGNTAEGGTVLISAKPSTKAAYVAQLRRMVAANPTATHLQIALANAEQA